MTKKKNEKVRCVIQTLGFLNLTHPNVVERAWSAAISFGGGTNPYNEYVVDNKGRIQISVAGKERLKAMENAAIVVHEYTDTTFFGEEKTTILESVVTSIFAFHENVTEILSDQKVLNTRKPVPITSSRENLIEDIKITFKERFPVGPIAYSHRSTYLEAICVLVVDNLALFKRKMNGVTPPHPLFAVDKDVAIYASQDIMEDFLPYLAGVHELPLLLLVLESKEIFDWIDNDTIRQSESKAYSKSVRLREQFLLQFRMELLEWQLSWLSSRCQKMLESLPKDEPKTFEEREKHLRKLLEETRNLEFYYSSYQILRNFLINDDQPQPQSFEYENLYEKLSRINHQLSVLGETLTKLEHSLERRVNIERMIIDLDYRQQQERSESAFKMVSLFFGLFFIFEVMATWLSWYYEPPMVVDNFITPIAWSIALISPLLLAYYVFKDFQKFMSNQIEDGESIRKGQDDIDWTILHCPYCNAQYAYDSSLKSVVCQNCSKEFNL